jgi:hypothetical protein
MLGEYDISIKHLWRIRGKYLSIFGDNAKSIYDYIENTTTLGLFAVHKIGAFNFPPIYLTIILG